MSLDSNNDGGWLTPERERKLLIVLFVVGFLLRVYPILWSSAHYNPDAWGFHPDEPKLVRHIDDFPESLGNYKMEDYRYPTLIPIVYGTVWMGVGGALGLRGPEPSMPGDSSYEAALLFGRGLTVLLFGLGGMWLTWAFTKRLFGPGPALFALAATNLMGLPMTSASLVQTDVPSTVLLLAVFYLLARFSSEPELRVRDFALVGLTLGAAAAAKYTAVIGAPVVAAVVVGAALRGDTTWPVRLVCTAALSSAVAFLIFVPGVLYDFEIFRGGLEYELNDKIINADAPWSEIWSAITLNYPLWVLLPAILGLVIAFRTKRTLLLTAIISCMAIFAGIWIRRSMPDHAIIFFPYVAALAGLGLWRASLLQPRRAALVALVILLLSSHAYSGWVVHQRYKDIRYELAEWIQENIPPGPVGRSPDPTRSLNQLKSRISTPTGYRYVKAISKPEWIEAHKKHYKLLLRFTEDPEQYKKNIAHHFKDPKEMEKLLSLEPGARKMGELEEEDFRFFEDVMGGERREFKYDEKLRLESKKLPLDQQPRPIYVFRRSAEG